MKALWMMNDVLPDFCEEFRIRKSNNMGWIDSAYKKLTEMYAIDISFCFPLKDEFRIHSGEKNGHMYYGFKLESGNHYLKELEESLRNILLLDNPDIIHIWGTEYIHSLAMYNACKSLRLENKVVVNIQGLVSIIGKHFMEGISEDWRNYSENGAVSIKELAEGFEKRGLYEIQALKEIPNVIGRTEWDKACTYQINPSSNYYSVGEILRNAFYENESSWDIKKCHRHKIVMSQGFYPVKGTHYMLEALSIVKRFYPDTILEIAGIELEKSNTGYKCYLESIIKEEELSQCVNFVGRKNEIEMVELYKSANVFVSSSLIENESNSVHEAMIIGVPVVSSYVGGVVDYINHGVNGFLYQCSASYMLAHYIIKIFDDDELAVRISNRASETMKVNIDITNNTKNLMEVYKKIIGENVTVE